MKKISLILCIIGISMIILAVILIASGKKNSNIIDNTQTVPEDVNNIKWELIYGNKFDLQNISEYEFGEYHIEDFYDLQNMKRKYEYLVLNNNLLLEKNVYNTNYSDNTLTINHTSNNIENLDNELKSWYNSFGNDGKISVFKINENKNGVDVTFILLSKATDQSFINELRIYSLDGNNYYSIVDYYLVNKKFSNKLLKLIIDSYNIEKSNDNTCILNNGIYNCTYLVGNNNQKIIQNIDNTKYNLADILYFNDYYHFFELKDNPNNRINVELFYDAKDIDISLKKYFGDKTTNNKIMGKEVLVINQNNDHQYYVYKVNKNMAVLLDLIGNFTDVNKVINDFLNIE